MDGQSAGEWVALLCTALTDMEIVYLETSFVSLLVANPEEERKRAEAAVTALKEERPREKND